MSVELIYIEAISHIKGVDNLILKVIDTFAGAGGFSLGFKMAGFDIIAAVEFDKWAAETYAINHPNVQLFVEDIREINDDTITDSFKDNKPDVILGGPPCQGFSHSNTNRDPKDPRNSLFEDYLRFVAQLKPKLCLIENVKGLLTTKTADGKLVIDIILREFEALGYTADFRLLNAMNFGVPQFRERLFIVAVSNSESRKFSWPLLSHQIQSFNDVSLFEDFTIKPVVTLWDAISDLSQITSETFSDQETYQSPPLNDFQILMRKNSPRYLLNHEPMRHTQRIVERYSLIGLGQSEADVSNEYLPRKRSESTVLSKAFDQNGRRQHPDRPCNTIVASSHSNFIHPFLNRNFTVRELARIQSFPDSFEFRGKRAVLSKKLSLRKGLVDDIYLDQRMQVGNAVPPLLSKALAESVLSYFSASSSKEIML